MSTSISPILFDITFSEPVAGFTLSDITIGGTAGPTTKVLTGSGAIYQVAVSGMTGSGTVTVQIGANQASSVSTGLQNVASNVMSETYIAPSASTPTVVTSLHAGQSGTPSTSPILVDVTFSEAVDNFVASDVAIGGTALPTSKSITGSGAAYVVTVSGMSQTGTVTVQVPAGVATATAGAHGANQVSNTTTLSYTFVAGDPTYPTLVSAGIPAGTSLAAWPGGWTNGANITGTPTEVWNGNTYKVVDSYTLDVNALSPKYFDCGNANILFRRCALINGSTTDPDLTHAVIIGGTGGCIRFDRCDVDGGPTYKRGVLANSINLSSEKSQFVRFGTAGMEHNAGALFDVRHSYFYCDLGWPDGAGIFVSGVKCSGGAVMNFINNTFDVVPATSTDIANYAATGVWSWPGHEYAESCIGLFASAADVTGAVSIDSNKLVGGGASAMYLKGQSGHSFTAAVSVTNNVFFRSYSVHGGIAGVLDGGGLPASLTWTGNTWEDGSPVTLATATGSTTVPVITPGSRPFADTSPWNTPTPGGTIWYDHAQLHVPWWHNWGSAIVVYVQPGDVTDWQYQMTDYIDDPYNRHRTASTFTVKGPAGLHPGSDSDHILVLVQQNGDYVETWNTVLNGGTHVITASGWATGNMVTGLGVGGLVASGGNNAGVRATNFSWAAGLITAEDIAAGVIPHALNVGLPPDVNNGGSYPNEFRAPATAADNSGSGLITEGSRLGIPWGVARPSGMHPIGNMIFTALQTYGAFCGDYVGGDSILIYFDPGEDSHSPPRVGVAAGILDDLLAPYDATSDMNKIRPLVRIADWQP